MFTPLPDGPGSGARLAPHPRRWSCTAAGFLGWLLAGLALSTSAARIDLESGFRSPPPSARPWVYWYFMDGNLTREGLTADLEAMRDAGIGGAIFLEVDLGIPRGPVKFMSPQWRALFVHAVREAERCGIEIALGSGPGWCGAGGPWVKAEQSMQHLVSVETNVTGPARLNAVLPRPQPRKPFFGEGTLTPELAKQWREFYRDEAVLAFRAPAGNRRLADTEERALYQRAPFSSQPGVKPYLPMPATPPAAPPGECIARDSIVDLTSRLAPDGRLAWEVPAGQWTIMRFGRTVTGQTTRPAPAPGLGFETDKFNAAALDAHFEQYAGLLLKELGKRSGKSGVGLTTLHFDSWEMSAQNWSAGFPQEFRKRRGYEPLRFLPAMAGRVVDSVEVSERFLWDLRQTAQELVIENQAARLKALARRHDLTFSMEPYDMNPCADLSLGSLADVPMCEFWSLGFNTVYSVIEAVSLGHTRGRPVIAAEAFTANPGEDWRFHPATLKPQGDWAFCAGVNRFAFHRYQHQPALDQWPGMTMGPYGVHWERTQTWWPMARAYHEYLARCQFLLRQGLPVADILYLAAEGAPHVFRPPASALSGPATMPDRRGYNFDGCAPETLLKDVRVKDGQLRLPDGMTYRVLVLPEVGTMTPALLRKLRELVADGATVIGSPPKKSPSLSDHPNCDAEVAALAQELWGGGVRGKGRVIPTEQRKSAEDAGSAPGELLGEAQWIWHAEGQPALAAPVGRRWFRRAFDLAPAGEIAKAALHVTADNSFTASLNGTTLGEGASFHEVSSFDVEPLLRPGANELVIVAANSGDAPNPAGLIACLEVRFRDGRRWTVVTDGAWRSALSERGTPSAAMVLGPAGMPPWGGFKKVEPPLPELYGDYGQVASVLARMGLPPDFRSEGPIRHVHRRVGADDFYFVANREPAVTTARCAFRVSGRVAELWEPTSGRRFRLEGLEETAGRTWLTLPFGPHESFFVVFRPPAKADRTLPPAGSRHPAVALRRELAGPWEVRFQRGRGAPEVVRLSALGDLSLHGEPGVKHFSGVATYRASFMLTNVPAAAARRATFLDLGDVAVMARVRLNGRDLGVLWTAPFRVEATEVLRTGENVLEIEVANLWLNRLIGDVPLPPAQRITRTTRNPFQADTPLPPSGLLGPVRLMEAEPDRRR